MRVWLTEDEAAKLVNRSTLTLRSWRLSGIVSARKHRKTWEFERESLLRALKLVEWRYRHRRIVPGPGRGRRVPSDDDLRLW